MSAIPYGTVVWSDETFTPAGASFGPMNPSGLSTSFKSELDRQWMERIADLRRIRSLREDWDGEGADAPKPEAIDSIEDLFGYLRNVGTMPPPSRVVASPNGSVIIEWQMENGEYLEAQCDSPYHAEWMLERPGSVPHHWAESWEPISVSSDRYWYRAA